MNKPMTAVEGLTNFVDRINAALDTIPREITITVTSVPNKDTPTNDATGGSLLAELRSIGAI